MLPVIRFGGSQYNIEQDDLQRAYKKDLPIQLPDGTLIRGNWKKDGGETAIAFGYKRLETVPTHTRPDSEIPATRPYVDIDLSELGEIYDMEWVLNHILVRFAGITTPMKHMRNDVLMEDSTLTVSVPYGGIVRIDPPGSYGDQPERHARLQVCVGWARKEEMQQHLDAFAVLVGQFFPL